MYVLRMETLLVTSIQPERSFSSLSAIQKQGGEMRGFFYLILSTCWCGHRSLNTFHLFILHVHGGKRITYHMLLLYHVKE